MTKWAGALVAAIAAVGSASAQEQREAAPMGRAAAKAYLTEYFSRRPQALSCGLTVISARVRRITAAEISETGIAMTCDNGAQHVITFLEAPNAFVVLAWSRDANQRDIYVGTSPSTLGGFQFGDVDEPARFVEAWAGLQRAPPLDPATDTAFQAALHQASSADRTEDQRRAQVRAEAFVGAGRAADALQVYQTELAISPGWAFGHYNAALVAAELHNYTLAITEMRRYLYLQPNASDARTAQDQIYRWEALLE